MAQVGSGEVAIVPIFKGFRRAVSSEVDGSAREASSGFSRSFGKTGADAGKQTGQGFKKAFEQSSDGFSSKATKKLQDDVAVASRKLSDARLKEQDATGKARVAEAQLNEARKKYADDSSQVIRAQERYEAALRGVDRAQGNTEDSSRRLQDAQQDLARAADRVGDEFEESGRKSGSRFTSGFGNFIGGVAIGSFLGNFLSNIASNIGQAISTGLSAGLDYIQQSVTLASSLQQSVGAVDAVFKDNAGTIHDWAAEAAQAVGLSENSYNEFATVVGAQLKNMAIPLDEATTLTGDLITVGADLAAQFGGSTSEAVSAISSLLRGERDPIERYGVSMKQADINARLAAQGLGELEGEALKQAEAQAALAILMEQTADAQGTFGRESDTLAGQQARVTAEWENAQATLGTALLPALTSLATMANTTLVPILKDLVEEVGPMLTASLAEATPAFADLLVAVAPMVPELVKLATEALPPLLDLIIAISPLLVDWATNTGAVVEGANLLFGLLSGDTSVQEVMNRFGQMGGSLVETARGIGSFTADAINNFMRFGTGVGQAVGDAISFVMGLPGRALSALGDLGSLLFNSGRSLIQGFIDGISDMIDAAGDAVAGVLDFVAGFFPHSPAQRGPFSGAGWRRVREGGKALTDQFFGGFDDEGGNPFSGFGGFGAGAAAVAGPAGSSGVAFPQSLVLRVGDRDFVAYLEEVADGRVAADGTSRSTVKTLGRRPGR